MNQKKNAMEIIRFGKPERVVSHLPEYTLEYHGVNHQGYTETGMRDGHDRPVGETWTDIWGTGWQKEYKGVMGFPRHFPLARPEDLRTYRFPDPEDERIIGNIYRGAEQFQERDEKFLCGSQRDTLWEKSYMLVGMENMMEYFYTEPEYAREILHRVMDFQLGIARHYVKAGIEMVGMTDDMGTQCSLLLGPKIVAEFLIPEYRRLFAYYKANNVLVNFHSCGHIEPLLETFMDLGVNILNPVQATANNLERVIAVTQGRMALMGGISSALLMDGDLGKIRETVRETIALLGGKGGYFCAPDQGMPYAKESLQALYDAVEEFGRYPLTVSSMK